MEKLVRHDKKEATKRKEVERRKVTLQKREAKSKKSYTTMRN